MTRLKWTALNGIETGLYHSPSDLAENIGISRPSTSRLLNALESDGYIERSLINTDGRLRHLSTTELGKQKIAECWPVVAQFDQYFTKKLTPELQTALCKAITLLIEGESTTYDTHYHTTPA